MTRITVIMSRFGKSGLISDREGTEIRNKEFSINPDITLAIIFIDETQIFLQDRKIALVGIYHTSSKDEKERPTNTARSE